MSECPVNQNCILFRAVQFNYADEALQLKRVVFISNRHLNLYRNVGSFNEQIGGILVKSVTNALKRFKTKTYYFYTLSFSEKLNG